MSVKNEGSFRPSEYVDAETKATEGDVVGWIAPGEWLEYTVDVQQAGNYNLSFRYASGNTAGGGPLRIESDGLVVKSGITVNYTGNWTTWATKSVTNIPLKSGTQILRLYFENGEFNLGELTFTYASPLTYSQPIADAGANQVIVLPQNNATLNGSASSDPNGGTLTYEWTQIYGPSTLQFSSNTVAQPTISTLVNGVYLIKLKVDNGSYSDEDEVYIIYSTSSNVAPKVSIFSPANNSKYLEGEDILITAFASDLNDSVVAVDFYVDNNKVSGLSSGPYNHNWQPQSGTYLLTAVAFDSSGDSTISNPVQVIVDPAPPCEGTSWNGDFSYRFSPDDNNPTITFIPSQPGVGVPTCILYWSTDPGNMPGYIVTPNVPYTLNASKGTKIYFYYTYSFPGAGERNNSANKDTYVIGSCKNISVDEFGSELELNYYPNPVTDYLNLELGENKSTVQVYNSTGQRMAEIQIEEGYLHYDMSHLPTGLYLIRVIQGEKEAVFKVLKE